MSNETVARVLKSTEGFFAHWKQFRYLPAAVLAVAAIAKASSVTQILSSDGPLALSGVLYTVIAIEAAAAVFIATADAHKSWLATVGVFLTFTLPFLQRSGRPDRTIMMCPIRKTPRTLRTIMPV